MTTEEIARRLNSTPFALFDLDGTLVESMDYWLHLGSEYLLENGIEVPEKQLYSIIGSMTMEESAEFIGKEYLPEKSPETIAREMNDIMFRHYAEDIDVKPRVTEYIGALKSADIRCAVATVTDKRLVESCLSRAGLLDSMDFVITCGDVGKSKREPDIYLEAARKWGAKPEEVTVYEDALYAAESAMKAGCRVVAVRDVGNTETWPQLLALCDAELDFN